MALILFTHMDTLFIRWFFSGRTILGASRSPKDQMWQQWEICMSNVCVEGSWISSWQDMENTKTHPVMFHSVKSQGKHNLCRAVRSEGSGEEVLQIQPRCPWLGKKSSHHYFFRSDHSHHLLSAFTMKFPSYNTANGHIFGSRLSDKGISIRCY